MRPGEPRDEGAARGPARRAQAVPVRMAQGHRHPRSNWRHKCEPPLPVLSHGRSARVLHGFSFVEVEETTERFATADTALRGK
jgi:hypothetical protein